MTAPSGQLPAAGFWRRFGARLVDGIVIGIPIGILMAVALGIGGTEEEYCTIDGEFGVCDVPTGTAVLLMVVAGILGLVGALFYVAKLDGLTGATLGRKAVGIRVLDQATLQPIGQGRAIGRMLMSYVSGFPLFLGFLWMLWDPRRQTWHDKVVDSVVVHAEALVAPPMVGGPGAAWIPPPPPPPPPPGS